MSKHCLLNRPPQQQMVGFCTEAPPCLNMHHDYAFNGGHDPFNENSFENKKLSTWICVLNVAFNICRYVYIKYIGMYNFNMEKKIE